MHRWVKGRTNKRSLSLGEENKTEVIDVDSSEEDNGEEHELSDTADSIASFKRKNKIRRVSIQSRNRVLRVYPSLS